MLIVIASFATLAYALTVTEKREVLSTRSFKLDGGERRFVAVYVPAPMETIDVKVSVSEGVVKFQPYSDAEMFEESLGYFEKRNESSVEMIQYWMYEVENETIGCNAGKEGENQVWYLYFLNEDSYEKEVNLEVAKVWSKTNYQNWM